MAWRDLPTLVNAHPAVVVLIRNSYRTAVNIDIAL